MGFVVVSAFSSDSLSSDVPPPVVGAVGRSMHSPVTFFLLRFTQMHCFSSLQRSGSSSLAQNFVWSLMSASAFTQVLPNHRHGLPCLMYRMQSPLPFAMAHSSSFSSHVSSSRFHAHASSVF